MCSSITTELWGYDMTGNPIALVDNLLEAEGTELLTQSFHPATSAKCQRDGDIGEGARPRHGQQTDDPEQHKIRQANQRYHQEDKQSKGVIKKTSKHKDVRHSRSLLAPCTGKPDQNDAAGCICKLFCLISASTRDAEIKLLCHS